MVSSRNRVRDGDKPTGEPKVSVSTKRRRLIKGFAAAAPGIFTLYSGNAQAMLSNNQCIAQNQDAFTGEQELAGDEHVVDGFVRLAEGPGIHVVRIADESDQAAGITGQAPGITGQAPGITGGAPTDSGVALSNVVGAPGNAGVALGNVGLDQGDSMMEDKWLIMVMDSVGVSHYIEAGHVAGTTGDVTSGITWNDSLAGVEWFPADDSGAGVPGSPLILIDPSSDPSNPIIFVQDFTEVKTIQVLACIDDSGNIVSAFPQDCDALGLAPPSGSCWSSIGTESMNAWWG